MKRCSGVLLPIFSLPSPYGIGTLGKAAYDWIDFLHEAGQQLWQVLPIGPTSFGDSPYQSFSAFAGNPYFIDLEQLCEDGLLQKEDCAPLADQADGAAIDYAKQYQYRYVILKKAYSRFDNPNEINHFRKAHNWVDDYALFRGSLCGIVCRPSANSGGVVFIFLARGRDIAGKPLNIVRPFFGQLRLQFGKLRISQKYILISAIAAGEGLSL